MQENLQERLAAQKSDMRENLCLAIDLILKKEGFYEHL